MNISLTPELEKFVKSKVKSGRYNNASEVIREALRGMIDHEELRQRMPRVGLADERLVYQHAPRETESRTPRPLTKVERDRRAVEQRKLARLRAAIDAGDRSPDASDFSFAKLRAKIAAEGRKRSKL